MIPVVNYKLVAEAISYYHNLGFAYVEVPWAVRPEISAITCPPERTPFAITHPTLNEGQLVGSAELGFLQMATDGDLMPGRYVAAGPCWRDDPLDEWHLRHFFKVELIEILGPRTAFEHFHLRRMVEAAKMFMSSYANVEAVETPEGVDLMVNGIEVGSYGHRKHEKLDWVYGTGLALPRFGQAAALAKPKLF